MSDSRHIIASALLGDGYLRRRAFQINGDQHALVAADSVITELLAAGWKIVRREPTYQMLRAGARCPDVTLREGAFSKRTRQVGMEGVALGVFRAMYDAAEPTRDDPTP